MNMMVDPYRFAGGGDVSDFPLIARTTTIEGGVIALTGLDLTDYQAVFIVVDGVQASAQFTQLGLQVLTDGVVRNSGYRYVKQSYDSANINGNVASQSADRLLLTTNVSASASYSGNWTIEITNLDTALFKLVSVNDHRVTSHASAAAHRGAGGGVLELTGTVDGFVLLPDSTGLISAGSMAVYGVKKGTRTPLDPELQSMWAGALL